MGIQRQTFAAQGRFEAPSNGTRLDRKAFLSLNTFDPLVPMFPTMVKATV